MPYHELPVAILHGPDRPECFTGLCHFRNFTATDARPSIHASIAIMNKIITTFALCSITCSVFAAETKEQLAEKFIEVSGSKEQLDETLERLTSNIPKQLGATPDMQPDMKEKIERAAKRVGELMKKEMGWEKMKPEMIKLCATTFTEEEMKAAIAFHETPAGQSFTKKSGKYMEGCAEIGKNAGATLGPKARKIVEEEMSDQSAPKSFAAIRANAIEKTVINDARQVASAAQQYMAENATEKAPLSEVRKFLNGEKLSSGVKIGLFNPKKPGEVKLFDISSKEGGELVLTNKDAFVLSHNELDTPASSKLKDNASTTKGTAAFTVESGQPLAK